MADSTLPVPPSRLALVEPPSLGDLAMAIKTEHEAARNAQKTAIERAIKCGLLLLEAQSRVKHGEWTRWVQENCNFGMRAAQNYLLLARHHAELGEYMSKNETDSFLTVRAALSLIHIDGLARHPAEEPEHEEPAAEERERESQAEYERELEREMSRGAVGAAAPSIIDLERYAHTRPFKCAPSYDPNEEEAQESPADDESLEELIEKLGAALLNVSRLVNKATAKLEAAPEQYLQDQSFPPILAATIKNLQDFEQTLRRWNSEAGRKAI